MCGALADEAAETQLVVIDRYNVGTPLERLYVFCPACATGRERAGRWMRLPDEATGITLETLLCYPDQDQPYSAVEAFTQNPRGWITLVGGYGVGKTTLVYAGLNALQARGVYGQYWTMPDMLDYLREAVRADAKDSASARLARIAALPVLAIDELDKYNATDWTEEQVFKLFKTRYEMRRQVGTIIGYNRDRDDLIPPFLRSRIKDGRFQFFDLGNADIRPTLGRDDWTPEEVWRQNP